MSLLTDKQQKLEMEQESARRRARFGKVGKKIAALIMAGALAVGTGAAIAGCSSSTSTTTPNTNIVSPDSPAGNTTDTTDNNTNNTNSNYSDFVNNILNNSEYNSLISKAKNNSNLYDTAYFDPHPYAFLESKGHDVSAIKNGSLDCTTKAFVKEDEPNNLYIATYVETNASTPYYTEYMLRYTLTDKEMEDYEMLHDGNYIQSAFANDQISKDKTATVISEVKMTVEAHEGLVENLAGSNQVKNNIGNASKGYPIDIMLKEFDEDTQTFSAYVFSDASSDRKSVFSDEHISIANLEYGCQKLTINNSIFYGPYVNGYYAISSDYAQVFNDNLSTITIYNNQDYDFGRSLEILT